MGDTGNPVSPVDSIGCSLNVKSRTNSLALAHEKAPLGPPKHGPGGER